MDLKLWPLIKYEDKWTIPDSVLIDIWDKMVLDKNVEIVFYDACIKDRDEWLRFIKDPHVFPVIVTGDKETIGLGWLTEVWQGTAQVHFCYLNRLMLKAGKMVLEHWNNVFRNHLHVLWGITPETYETVLKIIHKWGFISIGTIPKMCCLAYEGKRVGAVISYYLLGGK